MRNKNRNTRGSAPVQVKLSIMSQDTRLRHKIMIGFTWELGYELISVRNGRGGFWPPEHYQANYDLVTFCVQEPFRKQSVQKDTDRQSEVQSRIHVSTSKTATRQTVSVQTLHQAALQASTRCNLPLRTAIIECVRQKGKNKESVKELCESIANTIIVIDNVVRMRGELGASHFKGICEEMEGYLQGMAQDLKDMKRKHRSIKGIFSVDEFRDAIQAYRNGLFEPLMKI
ncbi:uncharacterized protein EV420DRAFT_1750294 [Desarmillaria tabescens]|uniref:Uncharacterized protein n=1 Tax=Armillaria tabescens TaxID=1929756 RepID=A0AA39JZ74_ARMTA|nr:uncharacterized protein EV420DRAFT_1750294 [Desarmillaria tabescens]KAK0450480.1 hypothetical protein EV420DRAFT_1750294 [Desarmillaria tabescens]